MFIELEDIFAIAFKNVIFKVELKSQAISWV